MILLLDNYDSFTFNLKQYVGKFNRDIRVIKNNELTLEEIKKLSLSHVIVSPGPGNQFNTGVTIELINEFQGKIPILGICLGH